MCKHRDIKVTENWFHDCYYAGYDDACDGRASWPGNHNRAQYVAGYQRFLEEEKIRLSEKMTIDI